MPNITSPFTINMGKDVFKLVAKEVGSHNNYTTVDGIKRTAHHALKTHDIATCTGLNLNTERNANKMFHLAPEFEIHQSYSFLRKFLETEIGKLQEEFGKVRAFLYGGVEFGNHPRNKESFNLYNNIADCLEDLDIPFSMLCGKKAGVNSFDNMFAINNKLTIWNDAFEELGKNIEKISNSDKLEFLKSKFQFVETMSDDFFNIM